MTLDGKEHVVEGMEMPAPIYQEFQTNCFVSEWNLFSVGTPIAVGARFNLLEVKNDPYSQAVFNQANSMINRSGFKIGYSSMHGERFSVERRSS